MRELAAIIVPQMVVPPRCTPIATAAPSLALPLVALVQVATHVEAVAAGQMTHAMEVQIVAAAGADMEEEVALTATTQVPQAGAATRLTSAATRLTWAAMLLSWAAIHGMRTALASLHRMD